MKIFVYGTLMKGHWNNRILQAAHASLITPAHIKGKLYYAYDGGFPAVVEGEGKVYGEVYEIAEKEMEALDQLEGYREDEPKHSMYLRKETIAYTEIGQIKVSYYLWNREVKEELRIDSGKWQ